MMKVAAFYAVFTPLSTLFGDYLVDACGWNEYLAMALNMAINFVSEYLYDRFIVFGKTLDTNKYASKEEGEKENEQ